MCIYVLNFYLWKPCYCEPVPKVWIWRRVVGLYSSLPGTVRNELSSSLYLIVQTLDHFGKTFMRCTKSFLNTTPGVVKVSLPSLVTSLLSHPWPLGRGPRKLDNLTLFQTLKLWSRKPNTYRGGKSFLLLLNAILRACGLKFGKNKGIRGGIKNTARQSSFKKRHIPPYISRGVLTPKLW